MKNNFNFTLPEFPNDNFEFENNIFNGKATLKQNGILVEQSTEKGKPFLIKNENKEVTKAFLKANFPDMSAPSLKINDKKIKMADPLHWYEYVIGGLPLFLIAGGALGGLFGGICTVINYTFLREKKSGKYLKVIGVNIACFIVYLLIAGFFVSFLK